MEGRGRVPVMELFERSPAGVGMIRVSGAEAFRVRALMNAEVEVRSRT